MHHELELMVEAGLTPMEALQSAALRAAEVLGQDGTFGTVEVGNRADMLLLAKNPLEDIRNTRTIEAVVLDGLLLDRSALLPSE